MEIARDDIYFNGQAGKNLSAGWKRAAWTRWMRRRPSPCAGVGAWEARSFEQMLQRLEQGFKENHSGEMRQESAPSKARRIIKEELERRGWTQ